MSSTQYDQDFFAPFYPAVTNTTLSIEDTIELLHATLGGIVLLIVAITAFLVMVMCGHNALSSRVEFPL